jgi:hypothetical protein
MVMAVYAGIGIAASTPMTGTSASMGGSQRIGVGLFRQRLDDGF